MYCGRLFGWLDLRFNWAWAPLSPPYTNRAPGQEQFSYDVIIPAQEEFGSDIPAGDGKLANLFFTVYIFKGYQVRVGVG